MNENRRRAQAQRDRLFGNKANDQVNTSTEEVTIAENTATVEQNEEATNPSQESLEEARSYRYPLTLSKSYPARIIFRAVKIDGLDLAGKIGDSFKTLASNISNKITNLIEDTTASVADDKVEPETKQEIAEVENQAKQRLQSFENKEVGVVIGRVTLPLQRDLRFSDNAQYETANLGTVGGALEGALQGRNPFAGFNQNGQFTSTASALAAAAIAKGAGEVAGAAIGSVGGRAGAVVGAAALGGTLEGLSPAVRSATRIATAPNQRTLFQQVQIRTFAFTFKMIATNADEAAEIMNIVRFFRLELYPEKIPLGESGVPLGYKFPNQFEIEVRNRFDENPSFKIQRCYLRDVQTTFNGTASGMYDDGSFIEVDVSLSFQESVALDKAKIREGY